MKARNLLSTLCGVIATMIIIIIGEFVSAIINPLPPGVSMQNPVVMKAFVANAPASLHITILIIYAIACFIGGWVTASIALEKKMNKAIILGCIFMIVGLYNLASLSHPTWVIIAGVFAFLPFAYLGGVIASKTSSSK